MWAATELQLKPYLAEFIWIPCGIPVSHDCASFHPFNQLPIKSSAKVTLGPVWMGHSIECMRGSFTPSFPQVYHWKHFLHWWDFSELSFLFSRGVNISNYTLKKNMYLFGCREFSCIMWDVSLQLLAAARGLSSGSAQTQLLSGTWKL